MTLNNDRLLYILCLYAVGRTEGAVEAEATIKEKRAILSFLFGGLATLPNADLFQENAEKWR